MNQSIHCSSGQLAIPFHQLLHQKLLLSLIIFKGREESGFVELIRVRNLVVHNLLHAFNCSMSVPSVVFYLIYVTYPSGYGFHEDGLKVLVTALLI